MTSVKVRIAHECIESVPSCRCSILADEPSWKCEIHGGYWSPPQCRICARFMKRLREDPDTKYERERDER